MAQQSQYPEEIITQKDMYPNVHVALFTIAKTWKQPRCPSTNEWIKKLWNIYTVEYYSAMINKCESVPVRWMNLDPVIQSEVSQKEKNKYPVLTHILYMESRKIVLMNLFAGQQ